MRKQGCNMNQDKNTPEKTFRAGAISATVWRNTVLNDKGKEMSFQTVSVGRSYEDKNEDWKRTSSMRMNDLPKAQLVIQKAYEYIAMHQESIPEEIVA
ncbi:MAG: hypothetical protein ABIH41_01485 [Nanoarchaeota archaeon]